MTEDESPGIRQVSWQEAQEWIMQVRTRVFVEEQQVDMAIEMDGLDEQCLFVLAETAGGEAIGTCRLHPDGKIGRLAVLEPYRHRGIGGAMLQTIIDIALQRGMHDLYLHGQVQAMSFYIKNGFIPYGEEFDEAGIRHMKMRLDRQS